MRSFEPTSCEMRRQMMRELAMHYEDLAAMVENAVLRRDKPDCD
jgi:hypothetical protein